MMRRPARARRYSDVCGAWMRGYLRATKVGESDGAGLATITFELTAI